MPVNTRALVDKYMGGEIITEADIDNLLTSATKEDLYLEYKSGKELLKNNASDTLRQYLTAFANSEGGLLIIGVSDSLIIETGRVPGGRGFGNWAATCLSDIFTFFSPPPRFQEINHREGVIFVAGVSRSPSLIACREGRGFAYYLRIHDQTRQAPEYLMSDLILGRRQYPLLNITSIDAPSSSITHNANYSATLAEMQVAIAIENLNLNWAEGLRMGILNYSCSNYGSSISKQLLSYVDMKGWPEYEFPQCFTLYHSSQRINDVEPFTETYETLNREVVLPLKSRLGAWFSYQWKAVLYLIGRNMPPIWYQLFVDVDQVLMDNIREQKNTKELIKFSRVVEGRPILDVDNLR